MKNYIGVKIVKAEPKEKNGVPGYAVKYPDGYVSWSPKETFEKAYRGTGLPGFHQLSRVSKRAYDPQGL